MAWFLFQWTEHNIDYIAQHGISQDDFEEVVQHPVARGRSRRSAQRAAWGYTPDGRYIMAIYEMIDPVTVFPVNAFEVEE